MGWRKDTLGRWRYSYRCDACNRSLGKVEIAPMLHKEIWQRIAEPALDRGIGKNGALLCEHCARQRSKYRLGRDLTMADLKPCEFNLYRSPPWFAVLPPGNMTPELNAQWDAVFDKVKRDEHERRAALG
jgi:hypothetical protein